MTDERERIEQLVRDGKVSEEEGRKLITAIEDAEQREGRPDQSEEAVGSPEARGGTAAKRLGILSRPVGWFGAGILVYVIGVAVHYFMIGPVIEELGSADLGSADEIREEMDEVASGMETVRLWVMPLYVLGVLFIIVSIVKWAIKFVVETVAAVQNRNT